MPKPQNILPPVLRAKGKPLSDVAIRKAKCAAPAASKKHFDGGGLYIEVYANGSKHWRFKYRFGAKTEGDPKGKAEKRIAMGRYPAVTLSRARELREEYRRLLTEGIDPGAQRKQLKQVSADRAANSFEHVARDWIAKFTPKWEDKHPARLLRRLERDVFPHLGARPIADIKAPELLAVIRRIEGRDAIETAHRVLTTCGQVFRFAVATGRAEHNPTSDLRGALRPTVVRHFSAITDPAEVGSFLKQIEGYAGSFIVQSALRLAPLVFVRPGELRRAEWEHIDLDGAEWRYRVTKTGVDHIVPLSTQAVAVLRKLHELTGGGRYVFPSARSAQRPMSDAAVNAAMRRMEITKDVMSGHGFRAMARTILDEVLGVRVDLIEHQLAHAVKDPNGRAYNRTAHLPERKKMMQQWADYLDELKARSSLG